MTEMVRDGLAGYAYITTYISIFVGFIILIIATIILYYTYIGHYKKSNKSKISYYNKTTLIECNNEEIAKNLCKLQLEYSSETETYKMYVDPTSNVGETSVYYQEKNPKSYMITPHPYLFSGVCCLFACFILVGSLIKLYILNSNKNVAAVIGIFDVADTMKRIVTD